MSSDDPLAHAISEWQRKHRIADDDPVIAVLELVRLQLQLARPVHQHDDMTPPSFEDFRSTIELLDRRSKTFINQATDLVAELRRFSLNLRRLNRGRVIIQILLLIAGVIMGALLAKAQW